MKFSKCTYKGVPFSQNLQKVPINVYLSRDIFKRERNESDKVKLMGPPPCTPESEKFVRKVAMEIVLLISLEIWGLQLKPIK